MLRKHEARNGSPAEYFADLGRQIVGTDRVLTEAVDNLDQAVIERAVAAREVKFNFGTPHFPAGQGAVERLVQELKKNLKVITCGTLSFAELDTALAEASYMVNCRPMQPNPAMGEDGFICPNDIIMGRSSKSPPVDEIFDNNLTRKVAHIQRIVSDFWRKWSSSYYLSLVKYHRWRLQTRNAEPGDVILVLDREGPKGKFTLGRIASVKTDPDNIVRKVTVRYKLPQSGLDHKLTPSPYKYAERNVRYLALVATAQECEEIENINIDEIRTFNRPEEAKANVPTNENDDQTDVLRQNFNDEPQNDEEVHDDEIFEEDVDIEEIDDEPTLNSNDEKSKSKKYDLKALPKSSTGRLRWQPKKLN